jgi:hypothetical protein
LENTRATEGLLVTFSDLKLLDLGATVQGRAHYELLEDLACTLEAAPGQVVRLVVPAGFRTDYASVPRFFWRIFPPAGRHGRAAVLHDWLYVEGTCPRFFADAMFRVAMETLGVPLWQRFLMYAAVRAFGWRYFGAKREGCEG